MNPSTGSGPWIVCHMLDELGRAATLEDGQAMADRHARTGIASVRNGDTRERWLRAGEKWQQMVEPSRPTPPPRRFRADIDGPA